MFGVNPDVLYYWREREFSETVRRVVERVFLVWVSDQDSDACLMMQRAPLSEGVNTAYMDQNRR